MFTIKITPKIILLHTQVFEYNSISGRINNVRLIFDCVLFFVSSTCGDFFVTWKCVVFLSQSYIFNTARSSAIRLLFLSLPFFFFSILHTFLNLSSFPVLCTQTRTSQSLSISAYGERLDKVHSRTTVHSNRTDNSFCKWYTMLWIW